MNDETTLGDQENQHTPTLLGSLLGAAKNVTDRHRSPYFAPQNVTERHRSASKKTPTKQTKSSGICIQNTPTPVLNQKHATAAALKHKQMLIKSKQPQFIVPNTPSVASSNNSKVFGRKKLLELNGGYFAADEMPGESVEAPTDERNSLGRVMSSLQAARITNAEAEVLRVNKKVSSIFRPKASATEENGQMGKGCDLSYGEFIFLLSRKFKLIFFLTGFLPPKKRLLLRFNF